MYICINVFYPNPFFLFFQGGALCLLPRTPSMGEPLTVLQKNIRPLVRVNPFSTG